MEKQIFKMLVEGKTEQQIESYLELNLPEGQVVNLKQKIQALVIQLSQLQDVLDGKGEAFIELALSDPSQRSELLDMLSSNMQEVIADIRRASRDVPRMTEEEMAEYLERQGESEQIESPGLKNLIDVNKERTEEEQPMLGE